MSIVTPPPYGQTVDVSMGTLVVAANGCWWECALCDRVTDLAPVDATLAVMVGHMIVEHLAAVQKRDQAEASG